MRADWSTDAENLDFRFLGRAAIDRRGMLQLLKSPFGMSLHRRDGMQRYRRAQKTVPKMYRPATGRRTGARRHSTTAEARLAPGECLKIPGLPHPARSGSHWRRRRHAERHARVVLDYAFLFPDDRELKPGAITLARQV